MTSSTVFQIRAELKANSYKKNKDSTQKFFKDKIKCYGVKTETMSYIAKKYWKEVKLLSKRQIFALCEELFLSGYIEEILVVSKWLPNMVERLEPSDLPTFRAWIENYVDNWASCDSFCNHTIGDLIGKYPELISEVKTWAKFNCRWLKRAAAVSLVLPARKGYFLLEALEICNALLTEEDDLVQKGYGWLLKEESRLHQQVVFDYVVLNRKAMPRTAFRYAIELMPKQLKTEAMKRN